mmetsp:Transcript_5519/g.18985  ORF Transcript_5519/g.18985 Transcript_5519/m.18985 type:complete len:210 (+) Transcript_5519:830-1459(+)
MPGSLEEVESAPTWTASPFASSTRLRSAETNCFGIVWCFVCVRRRSMEEVFSSFSWAACRSSITPVNASSSSRETVLSALRSISWKSDLALSALISVSRTFPSPAWNSSRLRSPSPFVSMSLNVCRTSSKSSKDLDGRNSCGETRIMRTNSRRYSRRARSESRSCITSKKSALRHTPITITTDVKKTASQIKRTSEYSYATSALVLVSM